MLDDDHRVAAIAQALDRRGERLDVGRMQADRRLIEHVEHVDQARTERRGERDALRLAAAERPQRPVEREISDADVDQVLQPPPHILDQRPGDRLLPLRPIPAARRTRAPSRIFIRITSAKFLPPTRTASASGRSRAPPHAGHG